MKAVFKPTNYTFTLADQYFVEGGKADGSKTIAAFASYGDAEEFAKMVMARPFCEYTAVYVFSRESQHLSLYANRKAA